MEFEPFQQRVINEKRELDEKLSKLTAFIETNAFNSLDKEDQMLLERQMIVMQNYISILEKRILRFTPF